MKSGILRFIGALLLAGPLAAQGNVVIYTDEAAFIAATAAESAPLPAAMTTLSAVFPVPLPPSPLRIDGSNTWMVVEGGSWASYGRKMILFGWERFDVKSSTPLHALAFSVYEPTDPGQFGCNTSCVDSTFAIKLYSGDTQVGSTVLLAPANNKWVFWGVRSDVPFDRVNVYDQYDDNEFFGSFRYGSVPPLTLKLNTGLVAGCKSVSGTVSIPLASATDMVVTLTDTLASATPPASVTIAAGSTSRSFGIKTSEVVANEVGTVSATLGGSTVSQPLAVRPIGMQSVTLKPNPVAGGKPLVGTAKLECRATLAPVTVALASSKPEIADTVAPAVVVSQGLQSTTFDVTTTPVLAKTAVALFGTANGIKKSKTLTVSPAASAAPLSLKFGNVVVNQTSAALTTTLSNKGIAPFSVGSIGITGTYASWFAQTNGCPASLAPGDTCTVEVRFTPAAAASKAAKLTIATSATSTPLSVSLSGTGVLPP